MNQYIGITGLMTQSAARMILASIDPNKYIGLDPGLPRLMFGVFVSSKTLAGHQDKAYNIYPSFDEIDEIFSEDPRVLNCAHYSTDDYGMLADQLFELSDACGAKLDAIRLNMALPDPNQLKEFKRSCSGVKLVLQVSPDLGGDGRNSIQRLAGNTARTMKFRYDGVIDKFLIDFSRDAGIMTDPVTARIFIEAFETAGIECSKLAFAGTLSPEKMIDLVNDYPMLSIDEESGLLDNPEIGGGFLNLHKVQAYLLSAFGLFMNAKDMRGLGIDSLIGMAKKIEQNMHIDPGDIISPDNLMPVVLSREDASAAESIIDEASGMTIKRWPQIIVTEDQPSIDDYDGTMRYTVKP